MRVDAGTSIALFAQAREDFHEQTAMETVISFLQTYGRPHQITFDRDPRWVGSVSGRDFRRRWVGYCCAWGLRPLSVRRIAPTRMPTWSGTTEPMDRSAYSFIDLARCRRCARSQRRFSSTTTKNIPTRAGPVAMSHPVWPFRRCLPYPRSQSGLTQMPG